MNQLPTSLLWVQCRMRDRRPNWLHTNRLFSEVAPQQQQQMIQAFKKGNVIYIEEDDMHVEALPMSRTNKQRLTYLKRFEQENFTLAAFQVDWAIFTRDGEDYLSMMERMEFGFLPKPGIAVDQLNVPILTPDGKLLDVFVPIFHWASSFSKSAF